MKEIYRHKQSGDIFGIETNNDGRVLSTCGPLFGEGFDPASLDFDSYWNREIEAKLADFEQISKADYLELLRRNGFVIESSQRHLF